MATTYDLGNILSGIASGAPLPDKLFEKRIPAWADPEDYAPPKPIKPGSSPLNTPTEPKKNNKHPYVQPLYDSIVKQGFMDLRADARFLKKMNSFKITVIEKGNLSTGHFMQNKTTLAASLSPNKNRQCRSELRHTCSVIIYELTKCINGKGEAFFKMLDGNIFCPTISYLCKVAKCSYRAIERAFRALKEGGYLIVQPRTLTNADGKFIRPLAALKTLTPRLLNALGISKYVEALKKYEERPRKAEKKEPRKNFSFRSFINQEKRGPSALKKQEFHVAPPSKQKYITTYDLLEEEMRRQGFIVPPRLY